MSKNQNSLRASQPWYHICEKDFNVDLRKDQNIDINMVLVVVD